MVGLGWALMRRPNKEKKKMGVCLDECRGRIWVGRREREMEGEEGGIRLSKRFSEKDKGEVDYKTKAGTAWSHSYLNQKPWHPLSYPNQRRKWIAEQTHANRERRAEEVAREALIHSSIPPSFFGFSVFLVAIFFC